MKKETTNSFANGLVSDLNAMTTPNNVLTDCLNGTFLTMNGNELVLQNDMGNVNLVDANSNPVQLTAGFIPLGVKESGGIIYIISYNPNTFKTEIGSFPSPGFSDPTDISDPSIIDHTTNPNLVIWNNALTGVLKPPSDINNIGITIPLSTKTMNVGDPFIVTLPGIDTSNLTDSVTRRFYIPKLIDITSSGEIDITSKFSNQQDLHTNTNNFWFLPSALVDTFQKYITAGKVQRFPNIKTGVLGIKFDLESIDEFLIESDTKGNNFPELRYVNADSSYMLDFNGFYIVEPSSIKCDTISLDYVAYDNTTGLVTAQASNLTGLNFHVPLTSSNQTIVYKITPSNTSYGLTFSNLIINDRIDLSKDSITWGLHPYLDVITTVSIPELIDQNKTKDYTFSQNLPDVPTIVLDGKTEEGLELQTASIKLADSALVNFAVDVNGNTIEQFTMSYSPTGLIATNGSNGSPAYTVNLTYELHSVSPTNTDEIVYTAGPTGATFDAVYYGTPATIEVPPFGYTFNAKINYSYYILVKVTPTSLADYNSNISLSFVTSPTLPIGMYSYLNVTGYSIHPLVGRFGTVGGLPVALDISNEVAVSTKQLIYTYKWYLGNVSAYDKEGTFIINPDNTAAFTSTQGLTELDKPVVRFIQQ